MAPLVWDTTGQRFYETGVDKAVLYIPDSNGNYVNGYAWNGLSAVTESPSGAESNPQYADNVKYLNLISAEEFGATLEAFTYPDQFAQCDGTYQPSAGVSIGQQRRKSFGLSYRTRVGNDVSGTDLGYKLHLVYGCLAAPSEKAYATINDSPEAISFSWEITTTPVPVSGQKPTAIITIDSTKVDPTKLATLETTLYGSAGVEPQLPLPDAVVTTITTTPTVVRLTGANAPSYNSGTHTITIPTVTGVTWTKNGSAQTPGSVVLTTGQQALIEAWPASSAYVITGDDDWTFDY